MKKLAIISLLLAAGCYSHAQCKEIQPEKAFNELVTIKFLTKKEARATMLQKLALRILKAVEGHINDVITITTKYANSYKAAVPKGELPKPDSAGRPETIAQTEEFIAFVQELQTLSQKMKNSIAKKITPLLERKIDTANTKQLDNASLYIRQQYDDRQKTSLSQLELSLPEIQAANTISDQMKLIKQSVDTAIRYFLKSTIGDHYEAIIDALNKLKTPIDLPKQLDFDSLKKYYVPTDIYKRIKIKPEQVTQERKKYKQLFSE